MANIKQQKKRNLTNEKQRLMNASFKSSIKTAIKAVEKAVAENNKDVAINALNEANTKLDKAVAKGFLQKNNASRHKSRLQKLVNTLA
ncbi:MAG: 30S ribosomal protein S20 [Bacilli bacterium]|jgi:small subunit ribosomal protein S20|nr:30S ribosomal protein S20 [Bacilli bacterium]